MDNKELDLEEMLAETHEAPVKETSPLNSFENIINQAVDNLLDLPAKDIIKVEGTTIILNPDFAIAYKIANGYLDKLTDAIKTAKETLLEKMREAYNQTGGQKTENNGVSITYKVPTSTEKFDSKKFQEEYPETYKKFTYFATVKDSLLIKVKE